jgi:hypothetical protein
MDEFQPRHKGDVWAVRAQMVVRFTAPRPYDLDGVDLSEYNGVQPPIDQWSHVADVRGMLSDSLLNVCI